MIVESFRMKNFKGIKNTDIEISGGSPGNIVTLIGLNESGKTTILEAIANFGTDDLETSSLDKTIQERQLPEAFVPKSKKGIFSGQIAITAIVRLEEDDRESLVKSAKQRNDFRITPKSLPDKVTIERRFTFDGGDLKEDRNYWTFSFDGFQGKSKKSQRITAQNSREIWLNAVETLRDRIPRITYFPTFLFTFPDRIYLETPSDWAEDGEPAIINRYYNRVLQDVADSISDPDDPKQKISIQKQVVDRLKAIKEPTGNPFAFWSYFSNQKEYDKVRSVLNLLAHHMGQTIFPAWNKIFDKPATGRVEITFGTDPENNNIPWIQISIFDGVSTYSLSERSLGFRWFFSFLLFTQFRKNREIRSIFLFDEPASNLHSLAQTRLMEGFTNIVSDGSFIIYSTHSHYLVNPMWLEKAYIIKNAAVDYEADLDILSMERTTDIEATRYRKFVNSNPSRISYFQPALDALRFNLGPMIPRGKALIVEGKFDYHPIEYFRRRYLIDPEFDIFPINGAGDAAPLLSLFRGWGISYQILLDDDKGGREARKRYTKDFGIGEDKIIMLGEISSELSGKAFEAIYSEEVKILASAFSSGNEVSKRSFFDLFLDRTSKCIFDENLGTTEVVGQKLITTLQERMASSA